MGRQATHAPHVVALDGVRGVALLAVLAFHFIAHGPGAEAWPAWVRQAALAGWAGVDLFFVLSGFLITRILLATHGRPGALRVFYVRRALRIFPPYYALLASTTAGLLIAGRLRMDGATAQNVAALWLYLTNFNVARHGWGAAVLRQVQFTHLWTLAIEEQFYLVWPWLVLGFGRRTLAVACVGLVVGVAAWRAWLVSHGGDPTAVYVRTDCRADALAWGALAAVAVSAWPARRVRAAALALAALGTAASAVVIVCARGVDEYAPLVQAAGYPALAAACCGWIAWLAAAPADRHGPLSARWLTRFGRYSYAAYLVHVPLRGVATAAWRDVLHRDPATLTLPQAALTVILLTAATLLAAAASFRWFEIVFLRHKPRLTDAEQHR